MNSSTSRLLLTSKVVQLRNSKQVHKTRNLLRILWFGTKVVILYTVSLIKFIDDGLYSQRDTRHAVVADQAYFDDVTYASGGSMLRMFERVMGTKDFFSALTSYLNHRQYKNANPEDLILEFEAVSVFILFMMPILNQ